MSATYRDQMEGPMENLAARQFSVVYKLLLATGKYTEAELDIILNPTV